MKWDEYPQNKRNKRVVTPGRQCLPVKTVRVFLHDGLRCMYESPVDVAHEFMAHGRLFYIARPRRCEEWKAIDAVTGLRVNEGKSENVFLAMRRCKKYVLKMDWATLKEKLDERIEMIAVSVMERE